MATIPVAGVSAGKLADTFGAPRSGGRSHAGIDIFAPRGTAVVAAAPGRVIKAQSRESGLGGRTVTVRGNDGRFYYYAHMDSVNARVGQQVRPGQPLGTVGNTGNARSTPPHLHFSVGGRRADDGAYNAYEFLRSGRAVPASTRAGGQAAGHAGHDHGGQDYQAAIQQQREAAQVQQIESEQRQADAEHQQRMLQYMGMISQGRENRGRRIPVQSAVRVNEQDFSSSGLTDRLRRLAPDDLTPVVARRETGDRAGMLAGMQRQLQQRGR